MDQRVAHQQQRDQDDDGKVAPVAAGDDLAERDGDHRGEEREVESGHRRRARGRWQQQGAPSDGPQHDERQQRHPLQGQMAGPVRDGGQQEAGDRGGGKPKEEFVGVPAHRIDAAWEVYEPLKGKDRNDQRNNGPKARQHEKRAKPLRQDGRALVTAITRNWCMSGFHTAEIERRGVCVSSLRRRAASRDQTIDMVWSE